MKSNNTWISIRPPNNRQPYVIYDPKTICFSLCLVNLALNKVNGENSHPPRTRNEKGATVFTVTP